MSEPVRCYDMFCGGGGSSRGAALAGAEVVGGIDRWSLAAESFRLNFPRADVTDGGAETADPEAIKEKVGRVDLLLASPECTSHSVAKGNAPRCETSRATAFQVVRYAAAFEPRWVVVENVTAMQKWTRFGDWLQAIQELGYRTRICVLDSQDYRTPQSRKRLFVLCDRDAEPSPPPKSSGRKLSAASILGRGQPPERPWRFRPVSPEVHAPATLERFGRAVAALGSESRFLLVYYGTDGAGGFQAVTRPLRTVTTLDRFAFVRPTASGHEMRMLQPPELAAAMGFPEEHRWPDAPRRERIKLIGNAVCPRVMCAVIRHLTQTWAGPTA